MNLLDVTAALSRGNVIWRQHALVRLMERSISRSDVKRAIKSGEIIEHYDDSKPYPGCLILGYAASVPLHVVLSFDQANYIVYIITCYEPDTKHFMDDLKTRKNQ